MNWIMAMACGMILGFAYFGGLWLTVRKATGVPGLAGFMTLSFLIRMVLLALCLRLFGNVMSEEFVIALLLSMAGLLVPVPIMLLAVITGLVQAYIFAVLSVVYLSAAVRAQKT